MSQLQHNDVKHFCHTPGIYIIYSTINDRSYVGSTVNLSKRKSGHLIALKKQTHSNQILQRHFNKHGENSIRFEVLEYVERAKLLEREQYYLDILKPYFNLRKIAESNAGLTRSEEARKKTADKLRGRQRSPETCEKLRIANTGKSPTAETRKKLSEINKNRSPELQEKYRLGQQKRAKVYSDEYRQFISKLHKGRVKSEKERQNISKALTGTKWSEERKRKFSETKKATSHLYIRDAATGRIIGHRNQATVIPMRRPREIPVEQVAAILKSNISISVQ